MDLQNEIRMGELYFSCSSLSIHIVDKNVLNIRREENFWKKFATSILDAFLPYSIHVSQRSQDVRREGTGSL